MNILDRLLNKITAQYWQGEWDQSPEFYSLWQPEDGGIQSLPNEYLGLPLPRVKGEFTYIGSNLPWRGLDVHIDNPNTVPADLISEYWNGRQWQKANHDRTHYNYATLNRSGKISCCPGGGVWRELVIGLTTAYWMRFSVTDDLSPDLQGWTDVIHNTPILISPHWTMKKHRLSACDNRSGRKIVYVKVLDEEGKGLYDVEVGFDTEPSHGIVYDHPDFWGPTDENGYIEWNHLGIPTVYDMYVDGEPVVTNIRTDFGNEYCGTGIGSWRPVNRPGIYSYWFELRRVSEET